MRRSDGLVRGFGGGGSGRARTLLLSLLVVWLVPGCARTPKAGGPIRIAVPYDLTTLDPHAETTLGNYSLLSNVYEPLVSADSEMRILPALAERWENPDPLTWVFHLRPEATFHDGHPLRADDVVFSFERLRRNPALRMRSTLPDMTTARVDELTVSIRTSQPTAILLNKLSSALIVPEGAKDEELGARTDGTGPYRVAGWKRGESLTLRRFDGRWASRGREVPETVEISLKRPPAEAASGLLEGRYQLVQCDTKKTAAMFEGSGRFRVLRKSNLFVKYLGFDLTRRETPYCSARPNPFRDLRVRQALHSAIDRHTLVSELSGWAVPALEPIPVFVFGYDSRVREASYDKEAARALLEEAGFGRGFSVVLHSRPLLSEAAELIRRELQPVGIDVEVRTLPDEQFFAALGRRDATLWLNRFSCASGDASDFLDEVIRSPAPGSNTGSKNYGRYENPELDRAIQRSSELLEPAARREALRELMHRAMDELVWIPLYNDQDVYAIDASLEWGPRSDSCLRVADIRSRR